MKKTWNNPAKQPPKESTMNTEGDFGKFTDFMRGIVKVKPEKKRPKPVSSSPSPVAT
jgi:hypothetical protein